MNLESMRARSMSRVPFELRADINDNGTSIVRGQLRWWRACGCGCSSSCGSGCRLECRCGLNHIASAGGRGHKQVQNLISDVCCSATYNVCTKNVIIGPLTLVGRISKKPNYGSSVRVSIEPVGAHFVVRAFRDGYPLICTQKKSMCSA